MDKLKVSLLLVLCILFAGIFQVFAQVSSSDTQTILSREKERIRIVAITSIPVQPDTLYVMMRIESKHALLADAIKDNKERVNKFSSALLEKGFKETSFSLKNFVVTSEIGSTGLTYGQNIVITLVGIDQKPNAETDRFIVETVSGLWALPAAVSTKGWPLV